MTLQMTTSDLNAVLSRCKLTKSHFLGTFAADRSPQSIKYPASIVWNTATSESTGEHWVCCFINENRIAYYFDSSGSSIPPTIVDHLQKLSAKSIRMCQYPIQSMFSDICGHYCIFFLISQTLGIFKYLLENVLTRHELHKNDDFVKKWFVKHMRKCEAR